MDVFDQTPAPAPKFDFDKLDWFSIGCKREVAKCDFLIADIQLEKFDEPKYPKAAGNEDTLKLTRLAKKLAAKEKITYVAVGDSITVRARDAGGKNATYQEVLGKKLKDAFGSDVTVVHAGVGGDTSTECRVRIGSSCIAHKPDLVTIYCGANDAAYDIDKEPYKKSVYQMIRDIRTFTDADIILVTPTPHVGYEKAMARNIEAIKELGKESNCPVADAADAFARLDPAAMKALFDPGDEHLVHLKSPGHAVVAELLMHVIQKNCAGKAGENGKTP